MWCDRRVFVNGTYVLTGTNVPNCDQTVTIDAPGHFVNNEYLVTEQRTSLQFEGIFGPVSPAVNACQCHRGGDVPPPHTYTRSLTAHHRQEHPELTEMN